MRLRINADRTIELPLSVISALPGQFGVWLKNGEHVVVGDVIHLGALRVLRKIDGGAEHLTTPTTAWGAWTTQNIGSPSDIGSATSVTIPLSGGEAATAWDIAAPTGEHERWSIHVHGLRSSRFGALRTVPATQAAGWRSLVVSVAGDEECTARQGSASTLGLLEAGEVGSALEYAVANGAKQVVLVGWSMGATAIMSLVEKSEFASYISGLVFVAPALDWEEILKLAVRSAKLPEAAADAAALVLGNSLGARLLGMPSAVDVSALKWQGAGDRRKALPTLILHNRNDDVVPFGSSARYAADPGSLTELIPFDGHGHCHESNQFPERFDLAIQTWLGQQFPTPGSSI